MPNARTIGFYKRQMLLPVDVVEGGEVDAQMNAAAFFTQRGGGNHETGDPKHFAIAYFDYLLALAVHDGEEFVLSEDQCNEADREFLQYYQRRICWLAFRDFRRAVRDADHSLAFMDFTRQHSPSEEWTMSHEQYRPFILFHRTQAAALAELADQGGPEAAIEQINQGLNRIRDFYVEVEAEHAARAARRRRRQRTIRVGRSAAR